MELKFVIPNMAKSLGNLEFGGSAEVKRGDTRRNGTQTKVLYRRYKLFSDVQRADDIEDVYKRQEQQPDDCTGDQAGGVSAQHLCQRHDRF